GALAHASNLYVSDSGSGTILQFDSSGNESVFTSGLNNPAGIAFDSGGNLYVADSGNGPILRYNSDQGTDESHTSGQCRKAVQERVRRPGEPAAAHQEADTPQQGRSDQEGVDDRTAGGATAF
ncbi:MAG: hypothetical protein ACLQVF_20760, partial [Isosphaeraceae bacterium]